MKMETRIKPSTTTNRPVVSIWSQLVVSAGVTLNSTSAKPIAIAKGEEEAGPRARSRPRRPLPFLLRGVVRRDRERTEADRERLAERNDAADDWQPEDPVPCHRRADRLVLRDVAVRLSHGERPVRGAAHHHALEDGLPPIRGSCDAGLASAGAAGALRGAAGSARRARLGRAASASPYRTDGSSSRSRHGARASWTASGMCSRGST